MKHLVLVSVIFFLGLVNLAQPAETRGPTITDLLKRLVESDTHRIYGWERIQGRNAGLPGMAHMASFGEENQAAFIQMVEEQTDYRCIVSKEYFLILPKEEKLPAGGGLAARKVRYPAAMNIRHFEYLSEIKAEREEDQPFGIGGALVYENHQALGSISMDAGSSELSVVLNIIAGKLNARCWVLSDIVDYDPRTRKPQLPRKLFFGSAIFYRTAQAIPFRE